MMNYLTDHVNTFINLHGTSSAVFEFFENSSPPPRFSFSFETKAISIFISLHISQMKSVNDSFLG